ncbi:class I SAM-dependent methyltransferase [Flavobacteriaceae bacterium LMO-SS05]
MTKHKTQWYASWFDTPFYHILYKDRDHAEAQSFMDTLTHYLNLPEQGKILDLACGRGRHSLYLNTLGFDVTGVDLSENNINYAKQFENESLHFQVHDMCQPYSQKFDAVFNLFTSFGYFDEEENNLNTIKAIAEDLNEMGFGVIDFMNIDHVIEHLVPEDERTIQNITFHQKRYVQDGYLFKDISFDYRGTDYAFQERIRTFSLNDFELLFEQAHVNLLDVFGDYKLRKYDKNRSDRLVMIFK